MVTRSGDTKKFPSIVRNDLDRLYDNEGGPAKLEGMDRDAINFGGACDDFPYQSVAPLLHKYFANEQSCRSHWPWVAMAAHLYSFDADDQKSQQELRPSEVRELFERIAASAKTLGEDLDLLRRQSLWPSDAKKPEARGHLAYLHEFFKQRALGDIDTEFVDDFLVQTGTDRMHAGMVRRLRKVRLVAEEFAAIRVDTELLKRSRGQQDLALPNLVFRLGQIWKSHTDRVPSANKVHKRDDDRSDFVLFVQSVVELAGGAAPSRAAVQTALR